MENEINLKSGTLHLNIFPKGEEWGPELEKLLTRNLRVLEKRLSGLLKSSFDKVEANLNIVSDAEISKLNFDYRAKDKATDVLSFPLQENVRRGDFEAYRGNLELGDIFIAAGVCLSQAEENGLSFNQEFVHLFTHGFLHLCGYDHEENEEEDSLMRGLENEIMEELASS